EISEFYFSKENNPSLTANLMLTDENDVHTAELPKFYSKTLIPTFKTNAAKVLVNNVEQQSGVTSRDFTQAVKYSFIGAKGAKKDITVQINWTNFAIPQFHIN